ncbi:carbamoyltransferase C-terminal domain-containing protein [Aeromonas sp. MR16]|uniref:carbamoyltransferase C-terminal domain-containing protein n=1 Tax=Aeromonas sp. MR16 TaxID=2923420 RepID=UPI001F4A433D|nr:carbamoyltransferase C-terminal domain-containing protein [Aeromonas sp. MR16]MCH7373591.1 hypothetical protein [Aeromonas sp. MR16]
MKEFVLGVNLPMLADGTITFDGNVVLASRDEVITAVAEERVSKNKYDGHVRHAVQEILDRNKLTLRDIKAVSVVSFGQSMTDENTLCEKLETELNKIFHDASDIHIVKSHHEAHALSAVSQVSSEFDRALVVVADHTGNIIGHRTDNECLENNAAEQTSYYLYENGTLRLVAQDHSHPRDQGYGRFYGDVTCYLGFNSYRESGKTMGLASFGDPSALAKYKPFVESETGEMISVLRDVGYVEDCTKDFKSWFKSLGLDIPERRAKDGLIRPFDMNLAAWAQDQLQLSISKRIRGLLDKYNLDKVCVTGGVAMNSVMNRDIEERLGVDVYVPPSPGDAGLALGAAAEYFSRRYNQVPKLKSSPYLGPVYSEQEIHSAIQSCRDEFDVVVVEHPELHAAQAISEGKVIGWFQGRSEYGPRALGNRSILALPQNSWMKEILNCQIKLREWFRPYAPVVLEEKAEIYFNMLSPVPYMMKVAPVTTQAKIDIPACIHADGTSRLQTVNEESNKKFYHLIQELERLTGVPVVLNTSFNLAGMPIVESPDDAISCFRKAIGIDFLVIENYLLKKKN